ncbi:MAG: NAD-dependent epimerase/dehydratase family protein [Cytophagales bacterium]
MKIIISGGAGFVGSNLALFFKSKYQNYEVLCLDNLKRRGSELNLARLKENGIAFQHADIRCKEDLMEIASGDVFIDSSAEPSVMAGITSPVEQVFNNNLTGTLNCLELSKRIGASFVFLSTSRVYPIQTIESLSFDEKDTRFVLSEHQNVSGVSSKGINENFPLKGSRSFYGTTKLASELLIEEYNALGGLKTVINRCGVLTGPWQMGKVDQGVVVLWAAKHFWKQKLAYIGYGGSGKQTRDILHVQDLFRLVDFQVHNIEKVNGELFNVGGGNEVSVSLLELTELCQEISGNKIEINRVAETRAADIKLYVTDNSYVTSKTGWKPEIKPKEIMTQVFDWLKENEKDLEGILK